MAAAAGQREGHNQMSVASGSSDASESRVLALLDSDMPPEQPKAAQKRVVQIKKPQKKAVSFEKPLPPVAAPTAAADPPQPALELPDEVLDEDTGSHGVAETQSVSEAVQTISIPLPFYNKLVEKERAYEKLLVQYQTLSKAYKELEEKKSVSGKSDNSPTEDGKHMRWDVRGNKAVRARYMDNKKDFQPNTPLLGVRIDQKNNSKTYMKRADFRLVWVNKDIVRDIDTGAKYSHKWGIFQYLDEESDKAVSVKLMYDMTDV